MRRTQGSGPFGQLFLTRIAVPCVSEELLDQLHGVFHAVIHVVVPEQSRSTGKVQVFES